MTIKFYDNLSQDLTKLLEHGNEYNTIIEVGISPLKSYKVHSSVLCYRCPYLYSKLKGVTPEKNDESIVKVIKRPDLLVDVFNIVVKYIYGGNLVLEGVNPLVIFNLALLVEEFEYEELIPHIESYLISSHSIWLRDNLVYVYQKSVRSRKYKNLQQYCIDAIAENPGMVFDSKDFTSINEDALVSLIEKDDLGIEETKIWERVIEWGTVRNPDLPRDPEVWTDEQVRKFKTTLGRFLPHIRYFQFSNEEIIDKVQPYCRIIDPRVWSDVTRYFITPNKPISTNVLPPRKPSVLRTNVSDVSRETSMSRTTDLSRQSSVLSSQSSLSSSSYSLSPYSLSQFFLSPSAFSRIITEQQAAEISAWIDDVDQPYTESTNPYKFQLILRGSNHGFDHKTFWKRCDKCVNLVLVMKVHGTDEIIGGFNPIGWNKKESQNRFTRKGFAPSKGTFLFSLKDNVTEKSIVSRVRHHASAVYNGALNAHGPSFGNGDLNMIGDFRKERKCYCIHNSYAVYHKAIRNTEETFSVEEYEIFQLSVAGPTFEGSNEARET